MLNLTGMLKAPEAPEKHPVFVATYSNGFGFVRREITAPNRFNAYAKATVYAPESHTLTNLRQKKGSGAPVDGPELKQAIAQYEKAVAIEANERRAAA